jgi:hypothetical protein
MNIKSDIYIYSKLIKVATMMQEYNSNTKKKKYIKKWNRPKATSLLQNSNIAYFPKFKKAPEMTVLF